MLKDRALILAHVEVDRLTRENIELRTQVQLYFVENRELREYAEVAFRESRPADPAGTN